MPNASLRICVPEGTRNYVTNPSFERDTTGWSSNFSATIERSTSQSRFGIASLKVTASQGGNAKYIFTNQLSEMVTLSLYARGTGQVALVITDLLSGLAGVANVSPTVTLSENRWKRIQFTARISGTLSFIAISSQSVGGNVFYIDGVQLESKEHCTTYCDGDQPGCRWNLTAHATESSRDPYTRAGGTWVPLAGSCRGKDEDDIYVTAVGGMGMPNISNNIQSFSQSPGSYFQNSKINDRTFILTFNVKKKSLQITRNPSLSRLHALRQQLIDILKPDKGKGDEEFLLEYTDGDVPIYLRARYEAGLEGSWDIRNQWVNSFPVRFLAVSPIFWEDSQEVARLEFVSSIGIQRRIVGRIDEQWQGMNYGVNGNVSSIAIGKNGEIYAGGLFTTVNNDAQAIDPLLSANRIASWNGIQWSAMGTGADNTIEDVAVSPNGYVYVTGIFLNIGGVAANRVAYWDGSAWNAMGTGLNGGGNAIAVAPNGDVYVGGNFTSAGGVAAYYVAKWDGIAWSSLGALNGFNANGVLEISISKDGLTAYMGGTFTSENGGPASTLLRVAKYDVATNTFSAMGSGFNATVTGIAISPNSGVVYAAGNFTLSGSTTMSYVSRWNGSAWVAMGTGMNASVAEIEARDDTVMAVGLFTTAGGVNVPGVALWNGSVWVNVDAHISKGTSGIQYAAIRLHPNGDIYIGGSSFMETRATVCASINLIDNVGSAEVSPVIYILGPGNLRWIENQTTGKRIYIDITALSNEEIFFDFARAKVYSSLRGDLFYGILPGSDFKAFKLVPGENKIAVFMEDDVLAEMQISYVPQHWSVDATAREEELQ